MGGQGLNPLSLGGSENVGSSESETSTTEDAAITRGLDLSLDDYYPQAPRSPESSAPPVFKPHPNADNPVIDQADVDASETFDTTDVADPFLVYNADDGKYYLLFEIITDSSGIKTGYASSPDGLTWSYGGTTGIGAAYPFTFRWAGEWYCLAENGRLFRADTFPSSWTEIENFNNSLPSFTNLTDRTPFYFRGRWWIIAGDITSGSAADELYLAYSEETTSAPDGLTWTEHPSSPITSEAGGGTKRESPAGRPIVHQDTIDVFYEDETTADGNAVSCYRITELTTSSFTDQEVANSPVSFAWPGSGLDTSHHIDPMMARPGGSAIAVCDVGTPWELWILSTSETYYPDGVALKAYLGSSQTVSAGTYTDVALDQSGFDPLGHFDTTDNKFVVPKTGVYEFYAQVKWADTADGAEYETRLNKNGSLIVEANENIGGSREESIDAQQIEPCAAGDEITVECRVDVDSGDKDLQQGADHTYFLAKRLM